MPLTEQEKENFRRSIAQLHSEGEFGVIDLAIEVGDELVDCRVLEDSTNTVIETTQQERDDALVRSQAAEATQAIVAAVESGASTQASNIPGWATWDEATALAWHDSNVGDVIDAVPADVTGLTQLQLVSVIQALVTTVKALDTENRAMARMIIAQRNKLFPNLQE
jgi:DUF1680 family protein